MKQIGALALLLTAVAINAGADEAPAAAARADACQALNNRILAPRSDTRPLALMRETPEHGFTPACSVPWSKISPTNDAIPVEACFKGSLLQIPNDSACGPGTGKLWVGARWVITSADMAQSQQHAAICQKLETGAWAGTRALTTECQPRTRELTGYKADASGGDKPAKTPAPSSNNSPGPPHP